MSLQYSCDSCEIKIFRNYAIKVIIVTGRGDSGTEYQYCQECFGKVMDTIRGKQHEKTHH